MTPNAMIDVEHFQKLGFTFLPTFRGGAVGVIARYDLTPLFYPADMPAERIKRILNAVNENLNRTYAGCGYYGHCSQTESEYPDSQVFVLFADDVFYSDYKSSGALRVE